MSDLVDCVVIGAGAAGPAIARRMALAGREVVVLEAEETFGTLTSARNSEVIHAGIYYESCSMKAKLCMPGKQGPCRLRNHPALLSRLQEGTLRPGRTGIRPRITGPGEPVQDFTFSGPRDHGIPELISLFGIESPGLTSSLAIADHVAEMLE
jgi:L-2-hydroxyglutarate oxidase LhgO